MMSLVADDVIRIDVDGYKDGVDFVGWFKNNIFQPFSFPAMDHHQADKPRLLPPAMFERSRQSPSPLPDPGGQPQDDTWATYSQATREIVQLRTDYDRLLDGRNLVLPTSEDSAHFPRHSTQSSTTTRPDMTSHRALDDSIARQAVEITHLRKEAEAARVETESTKERLAARLAVKDEQITYLESKLNDMETKHKKEMTVLQTEHQREVQVLKTALSDLREASQVNENSYLQSISHLKQELTNAHEELREHRAEVTALKERTEKMKVYLSEIKNDDREGWKKEKHNMENVIKELTNTKDCLQANNNLINVRLQSVNEILSLQEKEMSMVKSDVIFSDKRADQLLTRWREKVFALMVQLKSSDISSRKDAANFQLQLSDYQQRLAERSRDVEVLNHVIKDREAELQMEKNRSKCLEAEVTRVQQTALMLDDQTNQDRESCQQLTEYVVRLSEKFSDLSVRYETCKTYIKSYNQRLTFASSRLVMLQGQLSRREAHWRLQHGASPRQSRDYDDEKPETEMSMLDDETTREIVAELGRVTAERDQLIAQIQQDARLLDERLRQPKQQFERQVGELRNQIADFERLIVGKNQLLEEQGERLISVEQELVESRQCVEALNIVNAQIQERMNRELEEQATRLNDEKQAETSQLEKKQQDIKREYMKTVVTLRQLERQYQRDRDRHSEYQQTIEQTYMHKLEKQHKYIIQLEQERNIMMTTLRQEGLVGRMRASPVAERDDVTSAGRHRYDDSAALPGSDLKSVLDDLAVLTADVEDDDDDDGR